MIRTLILALALMAPIAAAAAPSTALEDPRRVALMRVLRAVGVEVGAIWPIGDSVYLVEAVDIIELPRTGGFTITVRTKLLPR